MCRVKIGVHMKKTVLRREERKPSSHGVELALRRREAIQRGVQGQQSLGPSTTGIFKSTSTTALAKVSASALK